MRPAITLASRPILQVAAMELVLVSISLTEPFAEDITRMGQASNGRDTGVISKCGAWDARAPENPVHTEGMGTPKERSQRMHGRSRQKVEQDKTGSWDSRAPENPVHSEGARTANERSQRMHGRSRQKVQQDKRGSWDSRAPENPEHKR